MPLIAGHVIFLKGFNQKVDGTHGLGIDRPYSMSLVIQDSVESNNKNSSSFITFNNLPSGTMPQPFELRGLLTCTIIKNQYS